MTAQEGHRGLTTALEWDRGDIDVIPSAQNIQVEVRRINKTSRRVLQLARVLARVIEQFMERHEGGIVSDDKNRRDGTKVAERQEIFERIVSSRGTDERHDNQGRHPPGEKGVPVFFSTGCVESPLHAARAGPVYYNQLHLEDLCQLRRIDAGSQIIASSRCEGNNKLNGPVRKLFYCLDVIKKNEQRRSEERRVGKE